MAGEGILVLCDRCEKCRRLRTDPGDGRWTCCDAAPAPASAAPAAADAKGKGKADEDLQVGGGAQRGVLVCQSCVKARELPAGLDVAAGLARCCDVPDAQVVELCGGTNALALLRAGVATQAGLAALHDDDEARLTRIASAAGCETSVVAGWVGAARSKELDEAMHDILAPEDGAATHAVQAVFQCLEEKAGISTPADVAGADTKPVIEALTAAGLPVSERDVQLWRSRALERLEGAPAWLREARSSFPVAPVDDVAAGGEDLGLLCTALDAIEAAVPDTAGEVVRYLARLTRNVVHNPDEGRYRRIRVDNLAYITNVVNVPGAKLALEALGWSETADGNFAVLPPEFRTGTDAEEALLGRLERLIAKAAAREVLAQQEHP